MGHTADEGCDLLLVERARKLYPGNERWHGTESTVLESLLRGLFNDLATCQAERVQAGRGRRRFVTAVVALLALSVGASAQSASTGSQSTILFTPGDTGMTLSSVGGGFSEGSAIELDFAPDTPPLPQKVVVEVPTGYAFDLGAKAGTEIGSATISIVSGTGPSFATGFGSLVARNASDPSDARLEECAAGAHAAVWSMSTSLAGQQLSLLVSVDAGAKAGVAYVLNVCTTSLASDIDAAASITLGLEGLVAPTAPGDYRWRALITPQKRAAYELQAVLPLPESLTIRARYDRKHKRALLSGRLIQGGQAVPGADLFVVGRRNDKTVGLMDLRTNSQGAFALSMHVTGTTDFTVDASPTVDVCVASATTECLGATRVPPDEAATTLRVSPPTGAVRALRAADQRRAESLGLRAADFPSDFEQGARPGNDCLSPKGEPKLTITGESVSPEFVRYTLEEPTSFVDAASDSRVYATAKQARQALVHQARVTTVGCTLGRFDLEPGQRPSIKPLRLAKVSARMRAFRVTLTGDGLTLTDDVIFLQRGRAFTVLELIILNGPADLETRLVGALATRMR
jgi:hypothetical protein